MTKDIIKKFMEETGMSVLDLLAITIDIARQDYTSELVTHRDHIIQGLYGGVQCFDCTHMGRDQLVRTEAPVSDMETQICTMDQGNSKLSGPPEVVLTGNSNQEQLAEERRPRKVVIRLRKNKDLSVEATESLKSNSHVTKATETKNNEMSKVQNMSVEATERLKSNSHVTKATETKNDEMNKVQVQKDFSEKTLENSKRRLQQNYEMAMCAKRQRSVKILSINELPKQGNRMSLHKIARAPSKAASRIGGH